MTENVNVSTKAPTARLIEALSSPLFLTLAVLLSVVTGASLIGGSINILYLLSMIGAWLVYTSAKKYELNDKGLALISGTSKAAKIICLVVSIFLIVMAVVFAFGVSGIISELPEKLTAESIMNTIDETMAKGNLKLDKYTYDTVQKALIEIEKAMGTTNISVFFSVLLITLVAVMFVVGVVTLVLSLTFYKTLHKFNKSVCERARMGAEIKKASSLRVWLMVFGIISGIGALSSISAFYLVGSAASLAQAGVYIVGSIWIGKYFMDVPAVEEKSPVVDNVGE